MRSAALDRAALASPPHVDPRGPTVRARRLIRSAASILEAAERLCARLQTPETPAFTGLFCTPFPGPNPGPPRRVQDPAQPSTCHKVTCAETPTALGSSDVTGGLAQRGLAAIAFACLQQRSAARSRVHLGSAASRQGQSFAIAWKEHAASVSRRPMPALWAAVGVDRRRGSSCTLAIEPRLRRGAAANLAPDALRSRGSPVCNDDRKPRAPTPIRCVARMYP